jgi:tetratricopeptide (TPR) repeat protein
MFPFSPREESGKLWVEDTAMHRVSEKSWEVLNERAEKAYSKGDFASAEKNTMEAISLALRLSNGAKLVGTSYRNLTQIARFQERWAEAEAAIHQSLMYFQQAYEPNHPNIVAARHLQGEIYFLQDKFHEATETFELVLDTSDDAMLIADTCEKLALCQNNVWEQIKLQKRALMIGRLHFPDDRGELARMRLNMGNYHWEAGLIEEAKEDYSTSADLYGALGENARSAEALHQIGRILSEQDDYSGATKTLEQALHKLRKQEIEDPFIHIDLLELLAECARKLGKEQLAKKHERAALQQYQAIKLEVDADPSFLYDAASNCMRLKLYASAEMLFRRSLHEVESKGNKAAAAALLDSLAINFDRQGKYDKAEQFYRKSLDTLAEIPQGADPIDVAGTTERLGYCFWAQHKYEEAKAALLQVMQIRKTVGAPFEQIQQMLPLLLAEMGRHREAKLLSQSVNNQQADPKHGQDQFWEPVLQARSDIHEAIFGELPEQCMELENLGSVWSGGVFQQQSAALGCCVSGTFGLSDPDMPTFVSMEIQSSGEHYEGEYLVKTSNIMLEPRVPVGTRLGLAGYGYELFVLTAEESEWPILFLSWAVQSELLSDIGLIPQILAERTCTLESVFIEGEGDLHFLVARARGFESVHQLPNGELNLLVATRISRPEMEFAHARGGDELLNKLYEGNIGQLSILDRPNVNLR